ncbi:MAG: prepilin peptidase [Patescibacteria group bacterium]
MILGVCIGSFLLVVIERTHARESILYGRSNCPACKAQLRARDLIPILSFFLLKRSCRNCHTRISVEYPIVEFVTGMLFVFVFLIEKNWILFFRDVVFISYLIIIFLYDLKYKYILDRFTIPAICFAFMANLFVGNITPFSLLLGMIAVGGFFLVQFIVSKGTWVGGGDIRMGVLMGAMLGLSYGLLALFLAYVMGAFVGLILLQLKRVDRKTQIPFGTFLSIATIIVLFVGPQILHWYLGFFDR